MRPLRWGDNVRWNSKNAFWGSPSYVLEPGDPGYVQEDGEEDSVSPKHHTKTMNSSNETPRNPKVLTALAYDVHDGMETLQDVIDLHHHRTTTVMPAILKLEGDPAAPVGSNANKGSQLVFKDCSDALVDVTKAMVDLSNGAVKTLLTGYRKVMEGVHGRTFNAGWAAAGFGDNSTAVPRDHDDRLALLAAMRSYLAAHATYETSLPQPAPAPALEITDAAALALHTQFTAARTLVNTTAGDQELCKNLRDTDVDGLYKEVSGSIAEIRGRLSADDPRWETFGLNIPANPSPPEPVVSVMLTAAGPGKVLVSYAHARRATGYRIFKKVVGVDVDFVFVDRAQDLEFTLKGLTTGQTVAVVVAATNEAGDAPLSPAVDIVVG